MRVCLFRHSRVVAKVISPRRDRRRHRTRAHRQAYDRGAGGISPPRRPGYDLVAGPSGCLSKAATHLVRRWLVPMGVLQRFERRIEEMVNRPFARAFKAEVQPVEIASALQRECDDRAAIVARGRTMVPNAFTVALGEHDHARLAVYEQALAGELAAMVREHADEQGYAFLGPVSIAFERDDSLETGRFHVRSAAVAGASARDAGGGGGAPGAGPWVEVGGTTYALSRATTTLGRGADADLRIDDPGISRQHAQLRRSGGDVTIVDLGSTNGVLVDGEPVSEARLRDGSRVQLGSTLVTFHAGGGA